MIERVRSKSLGFVAGLTIAVVEMPLHQVHCKLFYDTMRWLGNAADICNLPLPNHVSYIDGGDSILDDSLFDDFLHPSGEGATQFSQRLGRMLSSDPIILSGHSAAASTQGSPRP